MSNNYNNQAEEENFSFDKNKKNPFAMPEGYFNSLANKLKHKMELEKELEEFPSLASITKEGVFIVPENYFLENENSLQKQYDLQTYPSLNAIAKPQLKPVANDYFETSKNKILNGIEIAEEIKQYTTLYSIEKQNNFALAPNYFDTVSERVKEAHHSTNTTKVSVFEQLLNYILKPKVAFVYSFTLIIGIASFIYFNKSDVESSDCKTLACLEKRELLNENNVNEFSDEDLYEMIDVDQLDKQLSGEEKEPDTITNKKTEH